MNGVAGAIFKVVGDVCAAKNLCVADEHVTSQRKGLRNKQGSLYCVIRWMYFGNVEHKKTGSFFRLKCHFLNF